MDKRLIGVIISGAWCVVVLLLITVFNDAFESESVNNALDILLVVGSPIAMLVSFFLVDFGACLKRLWRIISSGIRVPVMPLNLILFCITFAFGLAIVLQFPIIVTLPIYLKGQPTETESA